MTILIESNTGAFPQGEPASGASTPGLTKREFFAALALQGLASKTRPGNISPEASQAYSPSEIAKTAVAFADALIEELNK